MQPARCFLQWPPPPNSAESLLLSHPHRSPCPGTFATTSVQQVPAICSSSSPDPSEKPKSESQTLRTQLHLFQRKNLAKNGLQKRHRCSSKAVIECVIHRNELEARSDLCQHQHGVGNWKTILSDCSLEFDSRSSVDLKDRSALFIHNRSSLNSGPFTSFRTYFPDAYQKHYPNARTHLSSKIRSTLPDGSPLFGKTRSKRRRPFTEEEDKALKAGYEKHGTIWAAIVKDPVFQEQNRRSTDLRDRFRNAYPDLYEAAGYKPRNNKKKQHLIDDSQFTTRAATDDLIPVSSPGRTGPVRGTRRRRAQTSQGILLRGGTKSVPQSTFPSEDEDSSLEDTDADLSSHLKTQALSKTPALADQPSMTDGIKNLQLLSPAVPAEASFSSIVDDHAEIDLRSITIEPLPPDPFPEYPPSSSVLDSQSQISRDNNITTHIHRSTWSSPVSHTPVNDSSGSGSNPPGSSTAANDSSHTRSYAKTSAPQQQHGPRGLKVGQSAWGPQEWLSPNPRLDSSFNTPINTTRVTSGNAAVNASPATENSTPGSGTSSSYFSPSSPLASFDLTPLHTSQPLSPSTTAAAIQTSNTVVTQNVGSTAVASTSLNALVGLTTLNLPISPLNNYSSHQHHHVIERYDLWPPALALSSSCSAVNNSSACSSVLGGSGGPFSGPGSLSAFSSSFCGDFESEVSLDTQSQTFSDDREQQDVFGGDETYDLGYTTTNATGNGGGSSVTRAITHHSDYAGDLIFGARGYGLGGGFGWFGSAYGPSSNGHGDNDINDPQSAMVDGPATGLGLVDISESEKEMGIKDGGDGVVPGDGRGNINPMQLHASSSEIDGPQERDVDEEMSDAAIDEDDDVMDGTNQLTTCPRTSVDAESELVSAKTPSPENQQQRQNVAKVSNSNSTEASPVRMGHISPSDKQSHHRHQQQSLHPDGFSAQHNHQNTHTMTHSGHSLSLSLGSSTMFSPSPASLSTPGANTYGRFSLDDLDLVDLTQPSALVDMNNLTPPATPMMQHITQLRGEKKYGVKYGIGLSGSGKLGAGGGSSFMPGREQTSHQEQGHSLRSISVPPSEAQNTISSPVVSFSPVPEAVERGRPKIVDTMDTAKRSLSSTAHDLPGPNTSHGHSLSLSTLPPLPSHSEIWRSTTPTARVSNSASVTQGQGLSVGANAINDATTLFSHLLSSPSNLFGSNTSGGIDPSGIGVNSEVNTHVDLPFLDSHYNFGQHPNNNQQLQQNFGATAMLVDTPAPTPDVAHSSSTDSGNGVRRMTQAEVEARLALDLAQPFDTHHTHENTAHAQALQYLGLHDFVSNQAQQSDFDYPGTSSASASDAAGLKALNHVFSIPPSLSRQVFPVTALMRSQQQQQQQQLGHQRMQSQQVVNPKDLVLNANGAGAAGLSASRLESKRKRASWDGSIL